MFNHQILKNKIAVVTGGAKGIGKAVTEQLAREGATVIFFYHSSAADAERFCEDAKQDNLNILAMKVDVRDKTQIDATIDEIIKTHGQIDILVNNSGIVRDNLIMGFEEGDIEDVFNTNILGMFYVTKAIVPYMMRKRAGKIINMSSVSGSKPGRGQSNYAATKGAVDAFTKALAVELSRRNILVNAVAPGIIETDISKEVRDLAADEIKSKILLKRYGQPEEVANLVTFLASPFADYINGQVINIDGGFKME